MIFFVMRWVHLFGFQHYRPDWSHIDYTPICLILLPIMKGLEVEKSFVDPYLSEDECWWIAIEGLSLEDRGSEGSMSDIEWEEEGGWELR